MFTYKLVRGLRAVKVSSIFTRNKVTDKGTDKGKATDPVQQLFLDKLREYRAKSPNDDLVDPSPSILNELKKELEKLDRNYGGGKGIDMTTFPTFKFEEVKLDSIDEIVPEKVKPKKKRVVRKKKTPQAQTGKKKDPKK